MSARTRFFARAVHGRTHRSAPTRWGKISAAHKTILCGSLCQRGGTEPAPYRGERNRPVAAGCGHPALRVQHRRCPVKGRCGHRPLRPAGGREGGTPGSSCPTGGCGEPPRLPWPAAHSGVSATRSRGMGGNRSRDYPRRGQQRRTIPQSRPSAVTAPFTQGSLGDGGCGLPRRFAPRNDSPDPLSF